MLAKPHALGDILEERNRITRRRACGRGQHTMRGRSRKTLRNRLEPCVRRAAQRQVRLYTCTHTTPRQHDNGGAYLCRN